MIELVDDYKRTRMIRIDLGQDITFVVWGCFRRAGIGIPALRSRLASGRRADQPGILSSQASSR
ncbi:MAG: hypothetical protein KUL81_07740 [Azonexus sp.]|nr:hypothetical protein [Azonexus sp.]